MGTESSRHITKNLARPMSAYRKCRLLGDAGVTDTTNSPRSEKGALCEYDVWKFVSQNPGQTVEQSGIRQQIWDLPPSLQCSQPQRSLPGALQSPNSSLSKVLPQATWIPCEVDHLSGWSEKSQHRKWNAASSRRYRERQHKERKMTERITSVKKEKSKPSDRSLRDPYQQNAVRRSNTS